GPTGVQRMKNSTLLEAVLSARGCGTAGVAQSVGGGTAVKVLTVERTGGQLSKSASTDQVTGPAGALWLSRCSAAVVPMTFGASDPAASQTLYFVAPGTLLQRRSNGAKTTGAPSKGAMRIERATLQSAGGVKVKWACADSTASQRSKSARTNQSMVPVPTVRRMKVPVVVPASDGAPPSMENQSS